MRTLQVRVDMVVMVVILIVAYDDTDASIQKEFIEMKEFNEMKWLFWLYPEFEWLRFQTSNSFSYTPLIVNTEEAVVLHWCL